MLVYLGLGQSVQLLPPNLPEKKIEQNEKIVLEWIFYDTIFMTKLFIWG